MRQRSATPVIVGTTALGGIIYYFSRPTHRTPEEQRRVRVESKRGEGLGGAGVGQNATTGGHETGQPGSGVHNATQDRGRKLQAAAPGEKLPDGGVGGGVGAGGANARAIEVTAKSQPGTASGTGDASSFLGGLFGTGGAGAGTGTDPETKDTRVASNYAGTPTKKHADWHDQHQPRAERSGGSGGSSGGQQQSSGGHTASQLLQGAFRQGGENTLHPDSESHGFRDTRIASNDTETPTKRA